MHTVAYGNDEYMYTPYLLVYTIAYCNDGYMCTSWSIVNTIAKLVYDIYVHNAHYYLLLHNIAYYSTTFYNGNNVPLYSSIYNTTNHNMSYYYVRVHIIT